MAATWAAASAGATAATWAAPSVGSRAVRTAVQRAASSEPETAALRAASRVASTGATWVAASVVATVAMWAAPSVGSTVALMGKTRGERSVSMMAVRSVALTGEPTVALYKNGKGVVCFLFDSAERRGGGDIGRQHRKHANKRKRTKLAIRAFPLLTNLCIFMRMGGTGWDGMAVSGEM